MIDKRIWLRLEFNCESLDSSRPIASIIFISLNLPDVTYCYVALVSGDCDSIEGNRYQVTTNNVNLIDSFIIREESITIEKLVPLLDNYEQAYKDSHFVVRQDQVLF
ncbi:hypothetical protein [Photobacterium profundum]|uniref:hypothetical protein n=1 Tax=Photobacterium profundum TaxID=74109 RepID=UPI003D0FBFBE